MRNIYIGVMSGTSRDNLDGCLVEFSENFQVHETFTLPFSKTYKTSKDEEFISKETVKQFNFKMDSLKTDYELITLNDALHGLSIPDAD